MKISYGGPAIFGLMTLLAGCGGSVTLETDAQKASYAVGLDIGNSLMPAAGHLDVDAFARGVEDVLAGRDPAMDEDELFEALQRFSAQIQESMNQGQAELAEQNRIEGQAYLAANGARAGVTTTASGLQWEVIEEGSGPRPTPTDMVTVHYRGTLVDGTEFDSSHSRGEPMTSAVTGLIDGFTEGLLLMPVGSTYRFVIPGNLAYGPQGAGSVIGPDATLIFEVELIEIP